MTEKGAHGVAGPSATFERECETLRPLGEAYVLRRFGGQLNHADAEDAVAEVLIRLHQRAAQGETPENLRAAFFTSVRNAAIDQLRARGARPTVTLDAANGLAADGVAPAEYAETREESAVLAEALAGMRRNYREALLMRFGIGLTIPEIAQRRGITLNAAKKLVLRGTRQAGQRLLDVTSEAHCEEMQTLAKRQLVEKYLADVGTEQEMAELEKHLEHCGRCKSLVLTLHHGLHEAASGAIVSGSVAGDLTSKVGAIDHLAGWAHGAHDHAQLIGEKVRLATFKATDALGGGDPAAGGAFAGAGAKIATACGGAAAAACLATGVVGPGVPSVAIGSGHDQPPAREQTTTTVPPVASTTTQTTAEQPTQTETTSVASAPAENPVQQLKKQLYGSGSTTSGTSAGSRDFGAPASSTSSTGGSGGGGSGGSRDNFGP